MLFFFLLKVMIKTKKELFEIINENGKDLRSKAILKDAVEDFIKSNETKSKKNNSYNLSKDYLALYQLLCSGFEVPCYVNYNFRSLEGKYPPKRDLCKAQRRGEYDITFGSRGIQYGSVDKYFKNEGSEFELFKMECERMNVEFIIP